MQAFNIMKALYKLEQEKWITTKELENRGGDTIAGVSVLSLFEQNSYTQRIENVQCISN